MKFFKHTETCYSILTEANVLEFYDDGAAPVSYTVGAGSILLCCNQSGLFVVHAASGDIRLGSMTEGIILNINKRKQGEVKSAVMYGGAGPDLCVALSTIDALVRLPVMANCMMGKGLPKITRDNGCSLLLSLHDGRSLAVVSEQGSIVSYDAHRINPSTGTLFLEKRATLEYIGSPEDVTSPKTPFVRLTESTLWYRSSPPLWAATSQGIFLFVKRRNLIVSLTIVSKQSALVTTRPDCLSKTLMLLATEDPVLAATVHNDVACVATTKGLWKVPLEGAAKKGLARSNECYKTYKEMHGWDSLQSCMFIFGNTLMGSNGKTMVV